MSAMGGMHMHDGMTSTAWSGIGAGALAGDAASYLGMWVVMTVVMMLPSVAPTLWRYRSSLHTSGATHGNALTALVGTAYLVVWTVAGLVVFVLGLVVAAAEARLPGLARAAPVAAGVVVLIAGSIQLTAWKARRLARCRQLSSQRVAARSHARSAWRHGLRLGRDCGLSCAGLMASVLLVGGMDLRVMAAVTVAITAERLVPDGDRVARVIGACVIAVGAVLVVRGAWLG